MSVPITSLILYSLLLSAIFGFILMLWLLKELRKDAEEHLKKDYALERWKWSSAADKRNGGGGAT